MSKKRKFKNYNLGKKISIPIDQSFADGISITFDHCEQNHKNGKRSLSRSRMEARFKEGKGDDLRTYFMQNCNERHLQDFRD